MLNYFKIKRKCTKSFGIHKKGRSQNQNRIVQFMAAMHAHQQPIASAPTQQIYTVPDFGF
jgi:hypothetical protein